MATELFCSFLNNSCRAFHGVSSQSPMKGAVMHGAGPKRFEQALVALVVITVCLSVLQNALPRLVPAILVVGIVIVMVRVAFFHTRKW